MDERIHHFRGRVHSRKMVLLGRVVVVQYSPLFPLVAQHTPWLLEIDPMLP